MRTLRVVSTALLARAALAASVAFPAQPLAAVAAMSSSPSPALDASLLSSRVRGLYAGMMMADALSMPVHWYYSTAQLDNDFPPPLSEFSAPKSRHPGSIMALSATGGAGRGSQAGSIIGDVINHGKKQYWGVPGVHYHRGLAAGANTLNALVARLLARTLVREGREDGDAFLGDYVKFMTTPGSHDDTFAESYHRIFFANYAAGKPPRACAGDDGHNIASAGALVLLPPVAALAAATAAGTGGDAAAAASAAAVRQQRLTHANDEMAGYR